MVNRFSGIGSTRIRSSSGAIATCRAESEKPGSQEARTASGQRDWLAVVIDNEGHEALLCIDVTLPRLIERFMPILTVAYSTCAYTPEEVLAIDEIATRRRMFGRWVNVSIETDRLNQLKRIARSEIKKRELAARRKRMIENNCTVQATIQAAR